MLAKNLVLEIWSKNFKANLNGEFFKLQYLTKKLTYEVDFFGYDWRPKKALNVS